MERNKAIYAVLSGLAVILALMAWSPAQAQQKAIILATTTSTQDSGLLDVLLPIFEKNTGYFVKTIAVGSGQAMAMGQKGEADVLLVHSPAAEKKFAEEGYGINRRLVMHNDFIIVGPPSDPAKIQGGKSASEAFRKIASEKEGANPILRFEIGPFNINVILFRLHPDGSLLLLDRNILLPHLHLSIGSGHKRSH